jgi:hypothetical protein
MLSVTDWMHTVNRFCVKIMKCTQYRDQNNKQNRLTSFTGSLNKLQKFMQLAAKNSIN